MNDAKTAPAPKSGWPKGRALHRLVVVACGALALTGAFLGWWVNPVWVGLAAMGGLGLLFWPETEAS